MKTKNEKRIFKLKKIIKNAILLFVTAVATFVFLISASCLDSTSNIPFYFCIGSMIWLCPFILINLWE